MKTKKTPKTAKPDSKESAWQKTKYANLVRYVPSGTLFARFKVRGKLIRRSLETTDLAVAKRELNDLIVKESAAIEGPRNGKLTLGEALKEYRERGYRVGIRGRAIRKKKPLKPRTRA